MKKRNFTSFIIALIFCPLVHAETIVLTTGQTIEGKIVSGDGFSFKVDIGEGIEINYALDGIGSIDGVNIQGYEVEEETAQGYEEGREGLFAELDKPIEGDQSVEDILSAFDDAVIIKGKFVPPEGKVLMIVGQDRGTIQNYFRNVGIVPGGLTFYTSIQEMSGLHKPFNNGAGVQHGQFIVDTFSNSAVQIGLYMVDALHDVVGGVYDDNIVKLGRWIKSTKRPVYLRIGFEFDNPQNDYYPRRYVLAYQRIVDMFREMGVDNVAYVWHSYASTRNAPVMDWYPGDDYVDWIAISYFNPYNTDNMNEIANIAALRKKPFMIAEATPVSISTSLGEEAWKRWFRFVFKYIEDRDVKAFSYINCHWDALPQFKKDQWGDARIEQNAFIKNKWMQTISDEKFLKGSPELFKTLGYQ